MPTQVLGSTLEVGFADRNVTRASLAPFLKDRLLSEIPAGVYALDYAASGGVAAYSTPFNVDHQE